MGMLPGNCCQRWGDRAGGQGGEEGEAGAEGGRAFSASHLQLYDFKTLISENNETLCSNTAAEGAGPADTRTHAHTRTLNSEHAQGSGDHTKFGEQRSEMFSVSLSHLRGKPAAGCPAA